MTNFLVGCLTGIVASWGFFVYLSYKYDKKNPDSALLVRSSFNSKY